MQHLRPPRGFEKQNCLTKVVEVCILNHNRRLTLDHEIRDDWIAFSIEKIPITSVSACSDAKDAPCPTETVISYEECHHLVSFESPNDRSEERATDCNE
jgi:hypothetical protein